MFGAMIPGDNIIKVMHYAENRTTGTKPEHTLAAAQKSSRVTVSFTDSDHDLLTQIAEDRDVSLSWVIRQAVSEYLDRNRHEEPGLPLPRPATGRRGPQ